MKKYFKYGIIFLVLLFIIIIGLYITMFSYEKIECSDSISEDNYKITNKYIIYHKKELVKKVIIKREIQSKNNTILNFFEKNYKDEFHKYNKEYGGYKITSKSGKHTITVIGEVDFNKVKYDKIITGRNYLKEDISKNHMKIDGVYKLFHISKKSCK